MKVHKVTAKNMREALELAQKVHGSNAVVLGQSEAEEGVALAVTTTAPVNRTELERMRRRADELFRDISCDEEIVTETRPSEIEERLLSNGCTPGFAAVAAREASALEGRHPLDAAAEVLGARLQVSCLPKLQGKTRVLALLGSSGTGKTLSLAKLGARFVRAGRRVGVAALTDNRPGAMAPLLAYGELLGTGVQGFAPKDELSAEKLGAPELEAVLLDTSGHIEEDIKRLSALAEELSSKGAVLDVQLVLSANQQAEAWSALFEAASILPVGGCIVTKLDETGRPGAVLEAIAEENLAVSFISAGSDLTRDLLRATPDVFADLFLRGRAS
mgnify:CR=1 FL=1